MVDVGAPVLVLLLDETGLVNETERLDKTELLLLLLFLGASVGSGGKFSSDVVDGVLPGGTVVG